MPLLAALSPPDYSPPVPVAVDPQGRTIPGEVPPLFGGEIVQYILVGVVLVIHNESSVGLFVGYWL